MRRGRALRALARIEWRELRRHSARSWLVLLLVAAPVAAMTGGAVLVRVTTQSAEERALQAMGRAAIRIDAIEGHAGVGKAIALLPEGARTDDVWVGREIVYAPGRRLQARLIALHPAALAEDGSARGMVRLVAGRAPAHAGEVALSEPLLRALDLAIADSVSLSYGTRRAITGIVENPESFEEPIVLRVPAPVEDRAQRRMLVSLSAEEVDASVERLRAAGHSVMTRTDAGAPDALLDGAVFALGTIGLLEAALVVAAAFAVGLRRRQRELGLLASIGATPSSLQVSLLGSSALLALCGSGLGVAVGTAIAGAAHPFLDTWTGRRNGSFEWPPAQVAASVALGILAALLAAAIPARGAARLPIRVALGGRRPPNTPDRRWLGAGAILVLAGLAAVLFAPADPPVLAAMFAIGGSALGLLGFGVASPGLLGALARCAGTLPLLWRLAMRDAGRFRTRNGPVVTAVLAGTAMSVTVAILLAGVEEFLDAAPRRLSPDQLLIEGAAAETAARRIRESLGGLAAAPLAAVHAGPEPVRVREGGESAAPSSYWIACGDEELLRALGAESELAAFRAGHLLSLHGRVKNLQLSSWVTGRAVDAPPVTALLSPRPPSGPAFLLNAAALSSLGLESGPPLSGALSPWLVRLPGPPDAGEMARAAGIAGETGLATVTSVTETERPTRTFVRAVLVLCMATGAVVLAAATALTASESVDDVRLLHTVGASPSVLRGLGATRAAYLALLGCVLAIPAGWLPAFALFRAANRALPVVIPWGDLAVALLGLPLLVGAGAWLLGRPGRAARTLPREIA